MKPQRSPIPGRWIGIVLLPMVTGCWAAEPEAPARAAASGAQPAAARSTLPLAEAFDLRNPNVRQVVRAAASTQVVIDYRLEPPAPLSAEARLAAAVREDRPAARKPAPAPRLPERPPPCDGFISCGIESLLGLEDFDDETYARVERNRLMNQGSFTSGKPNAAISLPMSPGEAQAAGAPLRP